MNPPHSTIRIPDPDDPFDPQTPVAEALRQAVATEHGISINQVTERLVNEFMAELCLAQAQTEDQEP